MNKELTDNPAYDGYLRPLVPEILAKGRAGLTIKEITNSIRQRVHKNNYEPCCDPSYASVRYVLLRHNVEPKSARPGRGPNHAIAYRLHQNDSLTPAAIATKLNLSRERVRQMIAGEQRRLDRAAKLRLHEARFNKLVDELFATPRPSTSGGRPIDMGGPRDTWIEKSPWDAI